MTPLQLYLNLGMIVFLYEDYLLPYLVFDVEEDILDPNPFDIFVAFAFRFLQTAWLWPYVVYKHLTCQEN